jgi:hypothetical protein
MRRRLLICGLAPATAALAACSAPLVIEAVIADPSRLPPPQRLVVLDFAVTPEEVRLDRGVVGQLQQALDARPLSAQQRAVARAVGGRVADAVAAALRDQGFAAERASALPAAPYPAMVLVEGQLLFADQGNTTRARWIGFGAGRSSVGVDAQLYHASAYAPPRALEDFVVSAESPDTPGLAGGLGIGAGAGRLVDAAILGGGLQALSSAERAEVEAEATAIGRDLGRRIAAYLDRRGWRPGA